MYRINEQEKNVITMNWLDQTVTKELIEVNKVWPYLTLRGFIKDQEQDHPVSIHEVMQFMDGKGYDFVCVSNVDLEGCKDIVFKYRK